MFRKPGPILSTSSIERAENSLPFPLPPEVREFFLKTNGGFPNPAWWIPADGMEPVWVKQILSIERSESGATLEEVYRQGIEKKFLNGKLVPFGRDPGGNFFSFDQIGAVRFVAMDAWNADLSTEDNIDSADTKLTDSFTEFVSNLVTNPHEE